MSKIQLYLSRRNLESLLTKLDRPGSLCTIIKTDTINPKYPLTGAKEVRVTAVENVDYYDRPAGVMFEEIFPNS